MSSDAPQIAPDKPGLKMNQLVEASGAPKSTILHYLEAGLLPKPVKTSPNMAYYSPTCIDKIRLIKELQSRHRLSLAEIKEIMDQNADEPFVAAMMFLGEAVFGPMDGEYLDRAAFLEATGLTGEQLDDVMAAGILMPLDPASGFDEQDLAMGRMLAQDAELGFSVADLEFYPRLGKQIVDAEMALRRRKTGHLPDLEDALLTAELTKSARLMRHYILDRIFQHRVAASSHLKDESLLNKETADD